MNMRLRGSVQTKTPFNVYLFEIYIERYNFLIILRCRSAVPNYYSHFPFFTHSRSRSFSLSVSQERSFRQMTRLRILRTHIIHALE